MTAAATNRIDRPDQSFVRAQTPSHVVVIEDKRGSLDLSRDASQHRRYTALYDDLQN